MHLSNGLFISKAIDESQGYVLQLFIRHVSHPFSENNILIFPSGQFPSLHVLNFLKILHLQVNLDTLLSLLIPFLLFLLIFLNLLLTFPLILITILYILLPHVLFIDSLHLLYVRDSLLFLALVDSFARRHFGAYFQVMLVHFLVNFNQMAEFLSFLILYFFLLQLYFL